MDAYSLLQHLGRGSEGNVVLVEHKKTLEKFAIKRLEFHNLEEANQRLNEVKENNLKTREIN
jgi:serine/threonine protein kinase